MAPLRVASPRMRAGMSVIARIASRGLIPSRTHRAAWYQRKRSAKLEPGLFTSANGIRASANTFGTKVSSSSPVSGLRSR